MPRTRVPHGTPASFQASMEKMTYSSPSMRQHSTHKRRGQDIPRPPPCMGKVEVQEVFEPADLASDWKETFMAKKVYVWMPKQETKAQPQRYMLIWYFKRQAWLFWPISSHSGYFYF